ncbi:MAG: hypothetical protein FWG07_01535 [Treponema sp.]|nr:hypothetical protein [Treponema sp.]
MPWRFIGIIAVLALLLTFIGLNLENTCSLNLGIMVFSNVPVYLTILVSFMLGMLFSLPFFIFRILKKKPKKEKPAKVKSIDEDISKQNGETETKGPYGID